MPKTVTFFLLASLGVLILLSFGGCAAFGDHFVVLSYNPVKREVETPVRKEILVKDFKNLKMEPQQIASSKTVYGDTVGRLFAENDIAEWVRNATIAELSASGFSVIDTEAEIATSLNETYILNGSVFNLSSNAYMEYEAEALVQMEVIKNSEIFLKKKYAGYGNAGGNISAKKKEYARSIELALQDALRKFIKDIGIVLAKDTVLIDLEDPQPGISDSNKTHVALQKSKDSSSVYEVSESKEDEHSKGFSTLNKIEFQYETQCTDTQGVIILSGGRKLANIKSTLSQHAYSLKSLHKKRSSLKHDIAGTICFSISIQPDGTLAEVRLMQSSLDDKLLEDQILEYLEGKVRFKKFNESEHTHIIYSFAFKKIDVRKQRISISLVLSALTLVLGIFLIMFRIK